MAHDGDILSIEVFSDWGDIDDVAGEVAKRVNNYLRNIPADRVVSISPSVTERTFADGSSCLRYTVTVVVRS